MTVIVQLQCIRQALKAPPTRNQISTPDFTDSVDLTDQ